MPSKTRNIKVTDKDKAYNRHKQLSKIPLNTRQVERTFLIVCEGETEKFYFQKFPLLTAKVVAFAAGRSHYALIEYARKLMKQDNYDETWCVFDMDYNPDIVGQVQDYNNAVYADNGKSFRCAYSNDAFELWFYLHYTNTEHKNPRDFYFDKLGEFWNLASYRRDGKAQIFSQTIYDKLIEDERAIQEEAIIRAKKLYEKQRDLTPFEQNPITKVYELVEILNQHLRR
jgi:RloB-like protein